MHWKSFQFRLWKRKIIISLTSYRKERINKKYSKKIPSLYGIDNYFSRGGSTTETLPFPFENNGIYKITFAVITDKNEYVYASKHIVLSKNSTT